ncbi:MAG: TolC family protein [Kiritimatiellae bacterium]|nr:TolC family protein [Kiritimatiellia bacterium]MDD5521115.1 TolC family protein [Kiritimatiellia bacterium]
MKYGINRISAIAFFSFFAGFTVLAENPPEKLELKLDDCIEIALQKNPRIRASTENIIASQEAVGEARASYYPELKATAGYSRWQSKAFLPSGLLPPTAPTVIGPIDDYKAQGTARLILFDSGERGTRLNISKAMAEISGADFVRTRQDIVLNVHEAFYRLSASFDLRNVATQNLARAIQHLRLATDRKSVGAVPEADVLRARVAASEAKLELVRAESLVRVNMGNLNTVMGLPVETGIVPKTETSDVATANDITASSLISQAIMCRPEIKASRKRIEAARSSLRMAKSEYGPKVRAEGAYGLRDDSLDLEDEEYAAGVSIELPLFSGFSTKHKVAEKKAELARVEAEAEVVIQAVQQEVWTAKSRLQESIETVQTTDLRVKDARENTRMAEERYKVGGSTITDLMDAQTALAKAEASLVEVNWNLQIAKAILNRSVGILLEDNKK